MLGTKTIISLIEICDVYSDLYLSLTKHVRLRTLLKSIENSSWAETLFVQRTTGSTVLCWITCNHCCNSIVNFLQHKKKKRWGKEKKEREFGNSAAKWKSFYWLSYNHSIDFHIACPSLRMYNHVHSSHLRSFYWFGGLNSLGLGELSESRAPTSEIIFPCFSASVQLQ